MLLRPGGVSVEELEAELGPVDRPPPPNTDAGASGATQLPFTSPGQMLSHYAPTLPVRLNADKVDAREVLIALGTPSSQPDGALYTLNLSESGDLQEAAANLFRFLHEADAVGLERGAVGIAVVPVPNVGLGLAMNDRLNRAAATRPPADA